MIKKQHSYFYRSYLLVFFLLFLFIPTKLNAQESKGGLEWFAELSEDGNSITLQIDPSPIYNNQYEIVDDIIFEVAISRKIPRRGIYIGPEKFTFTVNKSKLAKFGNKFFLIPHNLKGLKNVEGIIASYYVKPAALNGNTVASSTSPNINALEATQPVCSAYDANGNLKPELIRTGDGKLSPARGYRWVVPGNQNNLCVEPDK